MMERLTEKHYLEDGYYMKCTEECNGEDMDCIDCPALENLVDRLGAYEDTGLTPERCAELAKAEKDGRLVVLPCKVGDTVFVTGRDGVAREMRLQRPDIRTVCTDEDNLCMAACNRKPDGFCAYRLRNDGSDIGKTVFLTREEAEAALKEAKKDD